MRGGHGVGVRQAQFGDQPDRALSGLSARLCPTYMSEQVLAAV